MKTTYTLKDIKKAIEMARELQDEKQYFDIEAILGLTSTQTSDINLVYSEEDIIKALNK